MKKIIALIASFILFFSTVVASGVWYYDTSISNNTNIQTVTIEPGQIIVFSLDKQVENVEFSTDSMFTIRTLEGGEWIDMSNNIEDYIPLRGFMVRNYNSFNLDITFKFKNVIETEKTIFQKTLKAGWNLVGPAYKNDEAKQVQILDFLGNSNFSHLLDLTGDSLVYSGENNILTKKTYSGEVPIPYNTAINHIVKGNSQLLNNSDLNNIKVIEGIAYGIFVPNDTTIPGSQEKYDYSNCDEVSQLLGLCSNCPGGYCGIETPTNIATTLISTGSINLEWSPVNGASKYLIYYGTQSQQYTSISETVNTTIGLSLGEGTKYYFAISSIDTNGNESPKSPEIFATTLGCDEVSNLLGLCEETYNITQLEAANALATKGIIDDHSNNVNEYNLNQNILKQEIAQCQASHFLDTILYTKIQLLLAVVKMLENLKKV